jgi:thiol-disulfide isomerase/thioredoxin
MIGTAAIVFAVLTLSSCAPKATSEPAPGTQGAVVREAAAPSASAAGSEVRALERLGLTVFPEPQPIPPVELAALDGTLRPLADLEGKYVFLNFWATWCPPCREEMPSIQRMSDQLSGADFAVYAVSVGETKATVEGFLKSNPYTFPIVLDPDGRTSAVFAGRGIPTTYILDRKGRAIAGVVGGRPWDTEEALSILKSLMETKVE